MADETVTVRWISLDGSYCELDVSESALDANDGRIESGYYGEVRRYSPGDGRVRLQAQADRLQRRIDEITGGL